MPRGGARGQAGTDRRPWRVGLVPRTAARVARRARHGHSDQVLADGSQWPPRNRRFLGACSRRPAPSPRRARPHRRPRHRASRRAQARAKGRRPAGGSPDRRHPRGFCGRHVGGSRVPAPPRGCASPRQPDAGAPCRGPSSRPRRPTALLGARRWHGRTGAGALHRSRASRRDAEAFEPRRRPAAGRELVDAHRRVPTYGPTPRC